MMRAFFCFLLCTGCPHTDDNGGGGDGGTRSSPCLSGTPRTTATAIVTGIDDPFGIAADDSAVYWTEALGHAVSRANKDGTGRKVLVNEPGVPEDMTSDAGFLYYMAYDQVKRVDKAGAAPAVVVASGYDTLHSHGLVADGTALYFAGIDMAGGADVVVRVDPDGGNQQILAQPGRHIYGLTMDAGYIYFNGFGVTALTDPPVQYRVAKTGGMVEQLSMGKSCFTSACDGKYLYCGSGFDGPYRASLSGGGTVTLCTLDPLVLLHGMVLVGDSLYTLAVPPDGVGVVLEVSTLGTGRIVANGVNHPIAIASDGKALFYTEQSTGSIMKVTP